MVRRVRRRPVATRDLFRWLTLLAATPVVFYAAAPFFAGALRLIAARRLGMDVPVALAVALIYAGSVVEVVTGGPDVWFESVSMFVFFLLVGRYLEMRARHRAGDLSDALARLTPVFADRVEPDGSLLRVGAIELAPAIAWSSRTGPACRPMACWKARRAASTRRCSAANPRRSQSAAATRLRRQHRCRQAGDRPRDAGRRRHRRCGHRRDDRARCDHEAARRARGRARGGRFRRARAGARGMHRHRLGDRRSRRAFSATVAVLVVACPCAFALAAPAAVTRTLAVLAGRGVLVVRPDALEDLASATHVMFDKTGTLTEPASRWTARCCCEASIATLRLRVAAALAQGSRHPLAACLRGGSAGAAALGRRARKRRGPRNRRGR